MEDFLNKFELKMNSAIDFMEHEFSKIHVGRISTSIFEDIKIDYYGEETPIPFVASITVPELRKIIIKPYEKQFGEAITKAILAANLGFTPTNHGDLIYITLPLLTEERRKEFVHLTHKFAENAKIAIRNIRRDAISSCEKESKDEDKQIANKEEIQKMTDLYIKKIDNYLQLKEKDLMEI